MTTVTSHLVLALLPFLSKAHKTHVAFQGGLVQGVYNSGGVTLVNGQTAPLQLNSSGQLITSGGGGGGGSTSSPVAGSTGGSSIFSAYVTTAATVNSSPGNSYGISAFNTSASTTYYIEFFNTTSVTLGTTVPVYIMVVPPGPGGVVDKDFVPWAYSTALSVAVVTAPLGSSAAPATTCYVNVRYK